MPRNIEILENSSYTDGASLRQYCPTTFELARAALRPEDTESLVISSPPGYVLAKKVEAHDTLYLAAPGYTAKIIQAEGSDDETLRSRHLWTPGIEHQGIDDPSKLILDVPLVGFPRRMSKPPRGSWMGLEVDESALMRDLVHVLPIAHKVPKPFDTASYVTRLLSQNR